MKRILLSILSLILTFDIWGQIAGDGLYRVMNTTTKTYVHVMDNTGSIDVATTSADMGAIRLYKNEVRDMHSDPATVINFIQHGSEWDFRAQGTGMYEIIKHYVNLSGKGPNYYQLSASSSGLTVYLVDQGASDFDYNIIGTANSTKNRTWTVTPIDSKTDNYFGVKPTLQIGSKYYAPFYASFAFSFASEGMKAYTISKVVNNIAILKEINETIIPASTPVIIECSSSEPINNKLNLFSTGGATVSGMLKGVYYYHDGRAQKTSKDARTEFDANTMRILTVKDGKLVYTNNTESLPYSSKSKSCCLKANQSYLPVPTGTGAELMVMTEEEYDKNYGATPGDVNGDGVLSVADANLIINHILGITSSSFNKEAADVTNDNTISIADVNHIINQIINK